MPDCVKAATISTQPTTETHRVILKIKVKRNVIVRYTSQISFYLNGKSLKISALQMFD